jgi:hypothetical protein
MEGAELQQRLQEIDANAKKNGGHDNNLRIKEVDKGYRLATPDDKWLNHDEWINHVISVNGNKVRIVILLAKERHTGAFRRLVTNVIEAGLVPEIVAPLFDMPLILAWWGWKENTRGSDFESFEDYWTPTKEWIART